MTLPELMVTFTVMGMIVAVLSSSLIVIFRQEDNTSGRLNVARAEQTVGMWVPADLASAVSVNIDPAATPCGDRPVGQPTVVPASCPAGVDLSGSNSMLLTWTAIGAGGVTVTTNVAYHFSATGDGLFHLTRIECTSSGGGWSCSSLVVLHDLPGPPGGAPFEPGVTSPIWVILVSEPLAPDAISAI